MARTKTDKSRLFRAFELRRERLEKRELSNPIEDRHVGIVVASATTDIELLKTVPFEDEKEFIDEAEQIREEAIRENYQASIIAAKNRQGVINFCGNRSITDLVFIGHGHLAQLHLSDNRLNWWHLARGLDHLKQGYVVQRHCGVLWNNLNIALGTFAVSDMTRVIAPFGQQFVPESLTDESDNSLLRSVYPQDNMPFDQVLKLEGVVRNKN